MVDIAKWVNKNYQYLSKRGLATVVESAFKKNIVPPTPVKLPTKNEILNSIRKQMSRNFLVGNLS